MTPDCLEAIAPPVAPDNYVGVYVLMEKVKRD